MQAQPGDWLIVQSSHDSRHARRALVLGVREGGRPPYTVRWLDTGHEALVFPGPDSEIVTAPRQAEIERHGSDRMHIYAEPADE
jgi:hypothetical protein